MSKYGQFCPVAKSLELLGDRWTLLIVRNMLCGMTHFNDIERALPGISRGLLARRLRHLQRAGVIEKQAHTGSRKSTAYHLTQAGWELNGVLIALMVWGETWVCGEPIAEEIDAILLMWLMRSDVLTDRLPQSLVVAQFDFQGKSAATFWLIMTTTDVSVCITDPGYGIDVLVTADVTAYYKLLYGRISYDQALSDYGVMVEGLPQLVRGFPGWFAWYMAGGLRAAKAMRALEATPVPATHYISKYGQFCPIAKALDVLGDRWTLMIVRDMVYGVAHFNDLERGLPGISRALLSSRLRLLQQAGLVEKRVHTSGRKTTEYQLTQAGRELQGVIGALTVWGEAWAFAEPTAEDLDPILLMWWLRSDVLRDQLPQARVVVQYDFRTGKRGYFWLVMTAADVTLCLTDPGYAIDVLVTADVAAFYKLWWGCITYDQAIRDYGVNIEGLPHLVRAYPDWFSWGAALGLNAVKAMREERAQINFTHSR
jgi:DNA-binding HxlR family transcriptional regulator